MLGPFESIIIDTFKLNGCTRNTTAVCSSVATVGYNYVRTNSDRLHVRHEHFGQIVIDIPRLVTPVSYLQNAWLLLRQIKRV